MRYLEIAEQLRSDIAAGDVPAGGALASESELRTRFGVSRVTVRRALERLRDEGIVSSRQGSGWFVTSPPLHHVLGRFGTLESALSAAGRRSRREVLAFAFGSPPGWVAAVLGDREALAVTRRNLADDQPLGIVTVWVRGDLAGEISRHDVEHATFYDLLADGGVTVSRATQTITAGSATAADGEALSVPSGTPMLVCRRSTYSAAGDPVLVSEHRYPAHRIRYEVEVAPVAPAGDDPVGLHLVEGASHESTSERRRVARPRSLASDAIEEMPHA